MCSEQGQLKWLRYEIVVSHNRTTVQKTALSLCFREWGLAQSLQIYFGGHVPIPLAQTLVFISQWGMWHRYRMK